MGGGWGCGVGEGGGGGVGFCGGGGGGGGGVFPNGRKGEGVCRIGGKNDVVWGRGEEKQNENENRI